MLRGIEHEDTGYDYISLDIPGLGCRDQDFI